MSMCTLMYRTEDGDGYAVIPAESDDFWWGVSSLFEMTNTLVEASSLVLGRTFEDSKTAFCESSVGSLPFPSSIYAHAKLLSKGLEGKSPQSTIDMFWSNGLRPCRELHFLLLMNHDSSSYIYTWAFGPFVRYFVNRSGPFSLQFRATGITKNYIGSQFGPRRSVAVALIIGFR
jgi:hypothetical protein